ncbi:MAG: extracellular matrix/biofilm biosynthesis regulator RemA family protein [Syntrophaceticus sp.]
MYLHIGGNMMVPFEELVMIIDLESGSHKEATKEYLSLADWENKMVYVGEKNKNKSVIITKDMVFYSPISVDTLVKRAKI